MRFVRRYRRINMTRALKGWSPVFVVDGDEVIAFLAGGRR